MGVNCGGGGGHMPFLVQELRSQDMTVEVLPDQQSPTYTLSAYISPGECHCVILQGWLWLSFVHARGCW